MITFELIPYTLEFNFDARTSRGAMKELKVIYLKLTNGDITGWGEICSLPGLSIDAEIDYITEAPNYLDTIADLSLSSKKEVYNLVKSKIPPNLPSLRMALETALLDLVNGGTREIFPGQFYNGDSKMKINGLVWMGHSEDMLKQVNEKVVEGFDCIKIKIGGIDFDVECDILDYIRRRYFKKDIILRLDANGSMTGTPAVNRLHRLAQFDIHSIEQPLKPGDSEMATLIKESPMPIALDEELIGVDELSSRKELLDRLKPSFLVLKPSLLGGFRSVEEWIGLASGRNIGWWITSSLESNIGLNAISQFTSNYDNPLHQGLGTGKLYTNNIESPLAVREGMIYYDSSKSWKIEF